MKRPVKIVLIAVASLIALVIAALIVVPIVMKGRVAEFIRTELNDQLDATVDFEDIDLSLLSTFPTLTAEVVGLDIVGKGRFEGKPLLSVQSFGAGLDLVALIRDDRFVIESITIDQPEVHVEETEDGAANYDIVKETESDEDRDDEEGDDESEVVAFQIRSYRIANGSLTYDTPDMHVIVEGLNHEGSAAIAATTQTLRSNTTIDALTVKMGRITYLKKAKVRVDVDATMTPDESRLDLEELAIAVNALSVEGSGTIGWHADALDLDVKVASGRGQSIKALVSAIPNAYAKDLEGIEASGKFSLGAEVKGQLGPDDDDIPAFSAYLKVQDGSLQYPDLPVPLSQIAVDAKATHPGGALDKLRLDVSKYAVSAGRSHASGSVEVTKPISKPNVTLALEGRFHAEEIANAYPLPDVEKLSGLITANLALMTSGEAVHRLEGDLRATDVLYEEKAAQPLRVSEAHLTFSPKSTRIRSFRAQLGKTDVALSGTLSPITVFLNDKETMTGNLRLASRAIFVDDFLSEEAEAAPSSGETTPFLLPDNIDAALAIDIEKLTYDELVLTKLRGLARLRKRKLTLKNLSARALGGSMKVSGTVATPVGKPATFDMRYTVDKASFAEAFEALPSMRAYAPIARFIDGRFSADLEASGQLGEDGSPKLRTIDADGLVVTLQSKLGSNFKPLSALSSAVPAIPKPLDLSSVRTKFHIEDGAVKVKPFQVRSRGMTMNVSGSHGLDQEMEYRVGGDVPISKVTGGLAKQVQGFGVDLSKVKDVGVAAKLTGSITNPRVSVEVDSDALRGAVAATVSAELEKQRQQALALVAAQNKKLLAEAEKRAAQIKREGRKAAEKARNEGYKRADQIVDKAGSNTFKQIAAKEGAKQVRKETDKRAAQLIREADKRADQVVAEAKKRAAELEAQADSQSRRAQDGATQKIAK